ncbi:MAG: DUF4430 domain-containing protein [Candidatus Pacebacteria bacterium]|nr:DUF4430 domain-containing protein [Candidatus Paceibacterota bacterium]PIR59837.1 MAG: hypothetical protein COU68_03385 [Candidatus Pacebacteria bacterium CG10_big_fil_rev_8_21_14_0_10_45_6]
MKQKLPIYLALAIGLIGAVVFFNKNARLQQIPEKVMETTISLSFAAMTDGQTALDLLKESAQVEYQEFDFGVMVTSINGVAADEKHYWGLYVNDEYATAGASETVLKTGDTMKWIYEEISDSPVQ